MSGESERRKSKKKSKYRKAEYDDDFVEKEVAKAMKQMEKAMKQAKIAEKEARRASKEESSTRKNVEVGGDVSEEGKSGVTVIQSTVTHPGTYIHVESAENIQVGSNNTMHIYKDKKDRKSSRRDSTSESDDEGASPPTREPPTIPLQDRDPSQLSAAERRMLDVLRSEREVTNNDMIVCTQHVGNWRRFLRFLDLDETLIEQIHLDYNAEGVKQIIYQGVLVWTRREGRAATLGALARVLEKMDIKEALGHLQP